jgi:hypothetical protein
MTRKILIVGVLDVPSSTNVAMLAGFKRLGCEVDAYNYRTIAEELGSALAMEDDFRRFLLGRAYDLIVFCKVNGMQPMILNDSKEIAPTWYWFMDPMKTARAIAADAYAMNATFASATGSDVAERFKMVNKNSHHLIEGFDSSVYYYEELKKIHKGVFIGHATPQRISEIWHLYNLGLDITIFGNGWPDAFGVNAPVYNEDERIEINQAEWVLNLPQDSCIFSDRVVKSLACGANIVSRRCEDIKIFNGYIRMYGSVVEVLKLVQRGHGDIFARGLSDMMKEDYSWQSVCKDILETLDKYKEGLPEWAK